MTHEEITHTYIINTDSLPGRWHKMYIYTQNTNTDSPKRNSQTRTHRHHTYTQLDEWPADRCDAELTKAAVCSQIETVGHYRQERERSKVKDDKRNCNNGHFSQTKEKRWDFRLMKSPKFECWVSNLKISGDCWQVNTQNLNIFWTISCTNIQWFQILFPFYHVTAAVWHFSHSPLPPKPTLVRNDADFSKLTVMSAVVLYEAYLQVVKGIDKSTSTCLSTASSPLKPHYGKQGRAMKKAYRCRRNLLWCSWGKGRSRELLVCEGCIYWLCYSLNCSSGNM